MAGDGRQPAPQRQRDRPQRSAHRPGRFPLVVSALEDKAETKTMLPMIEAFMAAQKLPDVTAVADAGMISEANQ